VVSRELMARVEARPQGVRPEDLLNLHFNDSYILGKPYSRCDILRAGQAPPLPGRRLAAAGLLPAEDVCQQVYI
jgi:hypothetical protein